MAKLSFAARRRVLVVLTVLSFLCLGNFLLKLSLLGPYSKEGLTVAMITLFLWIFIAGPTKQEFDEYRKSKGPRLND